MKKITLFILLSCAWGFALGTLVLLGPARWWVTYARANNYTAKTENLLVIICIATLIIFSILIAWRSSGFIVRSTNKPLNFLFVAIPVMGACVALFAFMNPKLMNIGSKEEILGKHFTIGAYPELDKLKQLKKQGYTAVISLLHPGVVPFEPRLIAQEQKDVKKAGIELIQIPMLPWIVNNLKSIDSLKKIVATARGKYYIHCYLGKDRVNVARRIIEEAHENVMLENKTFLHRTLDSVQ
ncbi:MAG: hypothetical protein H0W75_10775, partial [Chitinophagaceae bacterium]|nr:hypothetical protein [Chitinophagaceae bacterium]